jgi:hypothetical protein
MKRMTSTDNGLQVLTPSGDVHFASRSVNANPVSTSHVRPRFSAPVLARQKGAILPIAIFFFLILCAGLLVVFNTAQVTSEKRHLTNAADAIAYSTATVAAEGLNYTSYTNRAMVANYSAVGQMNAMWSVMAMSDQYWKNFPTVMGGVAALARFIPWIGPALSGVMKTIKTFGEYWQKVTHIARWGTQLLANAGTLALSMTNYALFTSQQVHLASTVGALAEIQEPLRKANAPNASYDPTTVGYQVVKSIADLGLMIKPHRPPKTFIEKMNSKQKPLQPGPGVEPFNLVHRLMTTEMFILNNPLGGRRLLPNAVGLWMSDGCNLSAFNGILTGLSTNGLVSIFPALNDVFAIDAAAATIEAFMNTVGLLATPITCLFDRVGGTRTIQLQDNKYAWVSIDTIPFSIFGYDVPLAGAATMSKVGRDSVGELANGGEYSGAPVDLAGFVEWINRPAQHAVYRNKYWGESTSPDDCLYLALPNGNVYEPRVGGACASIAPGSAKKYYQRGIFNHAPTAGRAAIVDPIAKSFNDLMAPIVPIGPLQDFQLPPLNFQQDRAYQPIPPAGSGVQQPPLNRADHNDFGLAMQQIGQQFRPANWRAHLTSLRQSLQTMFSSRLPVGDPNNQQNGGIDPAIEALLNVLGLGDLVDALLMRSSLGTETLFQKNGMQGFIAADMGMPAERAWLWEMTNSEIGNYEAGDLSGAEGWGMGLAPGGWLMSTPEIQEAALGDLGPTFTVGLRQPLDTFRTASNLGMGRGRLQMADWDSAQNGKDDTYIRSIGKARVYYRAPLERWTTRQQLVTHANLMLPYWNARLEGISYPEKAVFAISDAITF